MAARAWAADGVDLSILSIWPLQVDVQVSDELRGTHARLVEAAPRLSQDELYKLSLEREPRGGKV